MPCNLAVAITKAALENEQLLALVDGNREQVMQMVASYIKRRHQDLRVEPVAGDATSLQAGRCTVTLERGQVTVTSQGSQYLAETLSKQVTPFMALVGDQLFADEVGRALPACATVTGVQTSDVTNKGVLQRATVYSIQKNGLKGRVFVLPGGRLQIFIDTGTFEQARSATAQLLQGVQAQGLGIKMAGEIEQHRDGTDHVHVEQRQKGYN